MGALMHRAAAGDLSLSEDAGPRKSWKRVGQCGKKMKERDRTHSDVMGYNPEICNYKYK